MSLGLVNNRIYIQCNYLCADGGTPAAELYAPPPFWPTGLVVDLLLVVTSRFRSFRQLAVWPPPDSFPVARGSMPLDSRAGLMSAVPSNNWPFGPYWPCPLVSSGLSAELTEDAGEVLIIAFYSISWQRAETSKVLGDDDK